MQVRTSERIIRAECEISSSHRLYAHNAGEARYDSPEAVSQLRACGVPPKERAASTGIGGERRVSLAWHRDVGEPNT